MPANVAFIAPPVRQVELCVFFEPLPEMTASHLSALRESWRADYPNVDEEFPLRPWRIPGGNPDRPIAIQGRFPCPLVTFSNESGDAISIQNDRILRRWVIGPQGYPGFDSLRDDLLLRFADLNNTVERELDAKVLALESSCRYTNTIEGMGAPELVLGLLTNWATGSASLSGPFVGFHLHESDRPESSGFKVTLSVDADGDSDSLLRIAIESDSEVDAESELGGLQAGHDILVDRFIELTNSDMHERWGRS